MKFFFLTVVFTIFSINTNVFAQEEIHSPCVGKCLNLEQVKKLQEALDELDDIHVSPIEGELENSIVIIRDWNGRIYVNGGSEVPIRLKIRIGKHIDRDMILRLKPKVWYKPEPDPPMFRLRIRAQAGLLFPEVIEVFDNNKKIFWDGGIGWDFFHISDMNMSVFTGVRSIGIGPGLDLTKNFGLYAGYSLVYDGFRSNVLVATYFSFN